MDHFLLESPSQELYGMGKGTENNRTPYTCRDKVRNQKRGAASVREAEYIASPAGTTVSWVAKSSGALP